MKVRRKFSVLPKGLRSRAEKLLATTRREFAQMPVEDAQKLAHELQVHQIELEMQNDELRRAQQELEAAHERLLLNYDAAPVGFLTLDSSGLIHAANLAAGRLLNYDRVKLPGQKLTHFIAPESQDIFYLHRRRLFNTRDGQTSELRMLRVGGGLFIARLESVMERARGKTTARCLTMLIDITANKQADEKLHQFNRTLRALNNSNMALLRTTSEEVYMQEVCRIIVEDCGYPMTWVGFAENDANKTVLPVASAGIDKGHLDTLRITWADTKRGRQPSGTAIRTGKVCQCRNIQADPLLAPWRAEAIKQGYAALVALPLMVEGRAFGVLTILRRESDSFTGEEVQLLTELATDFSQGITALRLRAAHAATNAALQASEKQYRTLFDTLIEGFCVIEVLFDKNERPVDCRFLEVNPAFETQTGLKKVKGRRATELGIEIEAYWFENFGNVALTGRPIRFANEVKALNRWFDVHAYGVGGRDSRLVAILFNDITERKLAEEALRQVHDELEQRVHERTSDLTVMNKALYRSERALSDFFDQSPIGLSWLSPSGTALRVNQALLDLLGHQIGDYLGHFFSEFLADPSQGSDLLKRLAARETIRNHRMLLRCKNGEIRHVLIDANSFWSDGEFRYSSVFLRDITDRIALEKEILQIGEREHRRISQDLHDGLGQFLVGAAYLTNNLRKDLAAKSLPEARQSNRILEVINETLAQTRSLARGLHPVEPEPNGLVVALQALADRTNNLFQVDAHFCCRRPVLIRDIEAATHLFRIAQEAVTNAIKHGKPGRIQIDLTRTQERIILAVRDDGVGLPSPRRKKLGMGLRIMRYRAGLIGGSLGVQKEAGGGTAVVCTVHLSGLGENILLQPPKITRKKRRIRKD